MKKIFTYLLLFSLIFAGAAGIGYYGVVLFTHGQQSVVLPNFVGKNIIYVLETTSRMGLNIHLMGTRHHDTIEEYGITFQKPEAGAMIKTGRDVSIYISKGKKKEQMPNLAGISLTEAKLILERQEIDLPVVSKTFSPDIPRGHVIAQSPRAFSRMLEERNCNLLVSRGKPPFPMPNLTGIPVKKAIEILSAKGITNPKMEFRITSNPTQGILLAQNPTPGSRIFPNSPVALVAGISMADLKKEISPSSPLLSHTLAQGFLKKQVRIEMDLGKICLTLMDEHLPPGKTIDLLLPQGVNTSIRIFVDNVLVREKQVSENSTGFSEDKSSEIPKKISCPWQFLNPDVMDSGLLQSHEYLLK